MANPRLLDKYRKEVAPKLKEQFQIKNIMAVPKIEKIVINTGIGRMLKDEKAIEKARNDLALLSGQKPIFRKARKSISGFKIREGMNIGLMATLRGKRMYDFLDRFISIALPGSKDFRGIDLKNVDKSGNLNIGIKEHSVFPEVSYESLKDIFSLEISVVTTAKDREKGMALLKMLGVPLKKSH